MPVAREENTTVLPAETVWELGADVKAGATELALTVRTASALVAVPPLLLTTTE